MADDMADLVSYIKSSNLYETEPKLQRWVATLQSLTRVPAQREQELSLEIESLKGAMQVLSEGYDRITAERDAALATHTPAALVETDDITEIVRCNARTTLIGFRDELSDDNIDFICDQVARKSQLDYVELAPVSRSSAASDYVHIDNVIYHLDDIEVDEDGKCCWTDVANAQQHIKACRERLPDAPQGARK